MILKSQNTVKNTLKEPLLRVITESLNIDMNDVIEFDAVVIGAGVVGLAVANEIADQFDSVLVIEKESNFGQHVSSRHSGVIHSGIYYNSNSLKAKLCVEGNKLLYDFCEKNNVDYLNCGKLIVGHNEEDYNKLKKLKNKGMVNGVRGLEILNSEDAKKKEQLVKCHNALWVPTTGIVDSHGLMQSLENHCQTKGVVIQYNSEIVSLNYDLEKYSLRIKSEDIVIESKYVINSAGLWCDTIAKMLGINDYKIHYCKGDYYGSKSKNQYKCLIYPLPEKYGLGIHSVIQLDGSVSFGPNAYFVNELDYSIDSKYQDDFYNSINKYLEIDKGDLYPDYTGIRPKPFGIDEKPKDFIIKNESELGFPNLVNLIGIESPGLTSCFAIANYVRGMLD